MRVLPPSYELIPDEALYSGAELTDIVRRIARNQNWMWARQGSVVAAFGQEPILYRSTFLYGVNQSLPVAYFTAPLPAPNGSETLRIRGYAKLDSATMKDCWVRVVQLRPGESIADTPSGSDQPYTEAEIPAPQAPPLSSFDFTFRVASSDNPARFAVVMRTGSTNNFMNGFELTSVTVTWEKRQSSRETIPSLWTALSQTYATANRPASAHLLRLVQNTGTMIAGRPRLVWAHSFTWPKRSSSSTGSSTLATYRLVGPSYCGVDYPITVEVRYRLTGQGAVGRVWVQIVGGDTAYGGTVATYLESDSNVYTNETSTTFQLTMPAAGDVQLNIVGEVTTAATVPTEYTAHAGLQILGVSVGTPALTAAQLALPGSDAIPTAYQPMDDDACGVDRAAVAENDRIGNRAGAAWLVRNLVWCAANLHQGQILADWVAKHQLPGQTNGTVGDGKYRLSTVGLDALWNQKGTGNVQTDGSNRKTGFTSQDNPSSTAELKTGGDQYLGTQLACLPLSYAGTGRARMIVKARRCPRRGNTSNESGLQLRISDTYDNLIARIGIDTDKLEEGWLVYPDLPLGTGSIRVQGARDPDPNAPATLPVPEVELDSFHIHLLPKTQADLDAL